MGRADKFNMVQRRLYEAEERFLRRLGDETKVTDDYNTNTEHPGKFLEEDTASVAATNGMLGFQNSALSNMTSVVYI